MQTLIMHSVDSSAGGEGVSIKVVRKEIHDMQWDSETLSKLSIWFTAYLGMYFFIISTEIGGEWSGWIGAVTAFLWATLALMVVFKVAVIRNGLISLLKWASKP